MTGECAHCGTSDTPRWRFGPDGKRSLCNACGLKWKRTVGRNSATRKKVASIVAAVPSSKRRRNGDLRQGLDQPGVAANVSDQSQRAAIGVLLPSIGDDAATLTVRPPKKTTGTRPPPASTLRRIVREEIDDFSTALATVLEERDQVAKSADESTVLLTLEQQQVLIDEVKRLRNELEKKDRLVDRLYSSLKQRDELIASIPGELTLNWNALMKIIPDVK